MLNSVAVRGRGAPLKVARRAPAQFTDPHGRPLTPGRPGHHGFGVREPAQHGAHASQKLAQREGLGDVVVRTLLQAHHTVDLLPPSREHDDRDGGFRAELAENLEAAGVREHDVQDDQIVDAVLEALEAFPRGAGGVELDAFRAEVFGQEFAQFRIVVDEQSCSHMFFLLNREINLHVGKRYKFNIKFS